jgi:serine/threonine protein kinase
MDEDDYGSGEEAMKRNIVRGKCSEWSRFARCPWPGAKNLIVRLLVINPESRLSALDVMNHPWLQVDASTNYL